MAQITQDASLVASYMAGPFGNLFILANDAKLCLLQFANKQKLEDELSIRGISAKIKSNKIVEKTKSELAQYYAGKLARFSVPLDLQGTDFQLRAWRALTKIAYGKTISYKEQALLVKSPRAFRAVAMANKINKFVIILPCHRVIAANGDLGGYNQGLRKKRSLLIFEYKNKHLHENLIEIKLTTNSSINK